MPLGAGSVKWLPDGTRLVFVSHVIAGHEAPEATTKALEAREKNKVKARVTENRLYRFWDRWLTDEEFPHLFVVDIATKKVTDLLPGSTRLFGLQDGSGDYDISPDGTTIVFSANGVARALPDAQLRPVQRPDGRRRREATSPPTTRRRTPGPVFSPDGTRIAYGREVKADGWPDYTRLAVMDVRGGAVRGCSPTAGTTAPAAGSGPPTARRCCLSPRCARASTSMRLASQGGTPRELHRGGALAGVEVTRGGDVVFQRHAVDAPPELAVGEAGRHRLPLPDVASTRS